MLRWGAPPPPRRAPVATLERPAEYREEADLPFGNLSGSDYGSPEHRVDPPSPDDVAPAPLPDHPPAAWDREDVADPPPAPADAQGGDLLTPPGASRELYIVEAITEEPDWGDIGGPSSAGDMGGPPPLDDAPFAEYSAPRPTPAPRPQPAPADAPAAPSKPGDIRAHPMYDEVKARFSGRVREIGKNRNYQPPSEEDPEEEGESAEGMEA